MLTLDEVLDGLRAAGYAPKRRGSQWESGCPACGGGRRRLFTTDAGSGTVRSSCRHGHSGPEVWRALGLLGAAGEERSSSGESVRFTRCWSCVDPESGAAWIHTRTDFFPPLPDGRRKRYRWEKGARSKRLIYRASSFGVKQGLLVVTEGERDADAVAALGIAALGTVTGSPAVPEASALADCAGRDVLVWGDDDEAGRLVAALVAGTLFDIAESVRVVDPSKLIGLNRRKGAGAADWTPAAAPSPAEQLTAAGVAPGEIPAETDIEPADEADAILAANPELARRAQVERALRREGLDRSDARRLARRKPDAQTWRWLRDVDPEPNPAPAASGLLWRRRLSHVWSREKVGKSSLIWPAIAGLTIGRDWLTSTDAAPVGAVVMTEEPLGDVRARFDRLSGDPSMVAVLPPLPLDDLVQALADLNGEKPIAAVVIDTLRALWTQEGIEEVDSGGAINNLVNRLATLAHDGEAAWLFSHHSKKDETDYAHSGAIGAAADCNIALSRVPAFPNQRNLTYQARWEHAAMTVERVDAGLFRVVPGTTVLASGPGGSEADILVMKVLEDTGEQSTRGICGLVRRNHRTVRAALDRLLTAGRLNHRIGARKTDLWSRTDRESRTQAAEDKGDNTGDD